MDTTDDVAWLPEDPSADSGFATQKYHSGEAILFAVDCDPSMLAPLPASSEDDDGEQDPRERTPLVMAMRCIVQVMQDKCIDNDGSMFGVLFFNTKESSASQENASMYVYRQLEQPAPESVLNLEQLASEPGAFEARIGCAAATVKLPDLLNECLAVFNACQKATSYHQIFLITNNDDPHHGDAAMQVSVKTRLQDMRSNNIKLSTFFLTPPDRPFDVHKFWLGALRSDEETDNTAPSSHRTATQPTPSSSSQQSAWSTTSIQVSSDFDDLLVQLLRRSAPQRSVFRVPFRLTEHTTIGVRGYVMYMRAGKPNALDIVEATEKPVKRVASLLCEDTGGVLDPKKDVLYGLPFAGADVTFTGEEMQTLTDFGESELKLLGFKPRSSLKETHLIKHSVFIFPDEQMYTNSITTFAALLDQMNQLEKVAVVNYQPRKGSTPRLAALVPQIEQNDSNGQVMPSGFHVVMLPFKDDLRSFAKKPSFKADDTLCDLMRPIVKKFRAREWTPTTFHNPMLQQFYSLLHAKALGREVEPIEDTTQPRYDVWNQRLAAQAKQFNDAFPAASAPVAQKRKAADGADSGGGGARKRRTDTDALPSLVTSDGKVDEDAVRRMVLDQGLMGYKVDELRAVLRAIGAGVSGSKAVLAGRIADSFSSVA